MHRLGSAKLETAITEATEQRCPRWPCCLSATLIYLPTERT